MLVGAPGTNDTAAKVEVHESVPAWSDQAVIATISLSEFSGMLSNQIQILQLKRIGLEHFHFPSDWPSGDEIFQNPAAIMLPS